MMRPDYKDCYPLLVTFTDGGWMIMYFATAEARDEQVEPNPDPPFVSLVALEPDKDGKPQVPKDHPAFKYYHGDKEDDNAPPPPPTPPAAGATPA